ncbi:MAG: amidase [Gammaproteobacteria bacterium]|nr:amidase [Gammaproteobacteria bacterium]
MTSLALADYPTARELAVALAARRLGAEELLDATLARVAAVNPSVNAIVTLDADAARATARALDATRPNPEQPLFGLPIAVKDLAQTRGLRTTYGSPLFADFVPEQDDLFVARLRAAGAVIIGKTNTPEFGAGSQTFNRVFGATRNPYDLGRTCGGSSGGAAVALATGMTALADGSDLGGSLRNPAAFCNVVGMRPSPGRVPFWPRQMSSEPLSVLGPMARNVQDCALLLSAMAGPDPRVPIALSEPGASFRVPLTRDLRGLRLGWSPDLGGFEIDNEVREVLTRALPVFGELGCTVDESAPDLHDADEVFRVLRAWQFAARFGDDFERVRDQLKDTVAWNVEEGRRLTLGDVTRAEMLRTQLIARVAAWFEDHDFLLCPATQVPPFPIDQEWVKNINGRELATYLDWMGVCYAITVTGLPAISVPGGFTAGGLPIGLQLVGRRWADLAVLQLAHGFEQATGFGQRRPPNMGTDHV